jgi:hypothetical protein
MSPQFKGEVLGRVNQNLPMVGQRIRYQTKTAKRGYLERETREGAVTMIWSNGWDGPHINVDDGGCCIPALGDTWEPAAESGPDPR